MAKKLLSQGTNLEFNSSNNQAKIIKISGNTIQKKRTGKNFYKETTKYGTFNGTNNVDANIWNFGTAGLPNGKYMGMNVVKITSQWARRWQKIPLSQLEAGKTYTMSAYMRNAGGDTAGYPTYIAYYYGTTGVTYKNIKSSFVNNTTISTKWTRVSVTFTIDTITDSTEYCTFRIEPFTADYENKSPHLDVCGLQFEEGDTATEYEEGGISPSPEYPSDVINVRAKNRYKIEGEYSTSGVSITQLSTGVRATLTVAGTYKYGFIDIPNSQELLGQTITLSAKIKASALNDAAIILYWAKGNNLIKLVTGAILKETGSLTVDIQDTFPDGADRILILFYGNQTSTTSAIGDYIDYEEVQLEIGSVQTSYAPFGYLVYTNVGRNKFNLLKCQNFSAAAAITNGIKMTGLWATAMIPNNEFIKVMKPNTKYICSVKYKVISRPSTFGSSNHDGILALYSSVTKDFIFIAYGAAKLDGQLGVTYESVKTFTTPSNFEDLKILGYCFYGTSGATGSIEVTDIMIREANDKDDTYEQYKEVHSYIALPDGQELCELSENWVDYIDSIGTIHTKTQIKELNGTEGGWYDAPNQAGENTKLYIINISGQSTNYSVSGVPMVCNRFDCTHHVWSTSSPQGAFLQSNNGALMFRINSSLAPTLEDFKTLLANYYAAGNPVKIYFEAKSEQQIITNQSMKLNTLKGQNNLECPSETWIIYETEEETDKPEEIRITNDGKLQPFGLTIDYNKTDLPLMAEAIETSQTIAGADGDIVLATTYGARLFDIVAVTDDFLSAEEKEAKREEVRQGLNKIKNKNTKLVIEPMGRTYMVKYSGLAEDTNMPKSVEFSIPLKSASAYGISNERYSANGVEYFESNTQKEAGFVMTIEGPVSYPSWSFNGVEMKYNGVLVAGQRLEINTEKYTVTQIHSTGNRINVIGNYNHSFPKIQNGLNNIITNNNIELSQIKIEWNDLLL